MTPFDQPSRPPLLAGNRHCCVLNPQIDFEPNELMAVMLALSSQRDGAWIACRAFLPGGTLMLKTGMAETDEQDQVMLLANALVAVLADWLDQGAQEFLAEQPQGTSLYWRNRVCDEPVMADLVLQRYWPWELPNERLSAAVRPRACPE